MKHVEENSECPQFGCSNTVNINNQNPRLFKAILKRMFTEYDVTETPEVVSPFASGGVITVTLLTGETIEIPYSANMEILEVKNRIKAKMGHDVSKQKFLHNDFELTVRSYFVWWSCIQPLARARVAPHFCLSPLQKHVRKVGGGFGKKSCVSTGVRKPGNTYTRHRPP